jgi:hypothetical protein
MYHNICTVITSCTGSKTLEFSEFVPCIVVYCINGHNWCLWGFAPSPSVREMLSVSLYVRVPVSALTLTLTLTCITVHL